jgi:hypothetical protein
MVKAIEDIDNHAVSCERDIEVQVQLVAPQGR